MKSPRDHSFVLNFIINDVLHKKIKQNIDIVFYDVRQCYDSLWVERTLFDLYKNGVQNNFLNLIYEACKSADISIKTPVGNTDIQQIKNIIMQGETLSSILCTNTMDRMSSDCHLEDYKYKNIVEIPKLGFVDDLVDIKKCGQQTREMNSYTNEEMNRRKLQLAPDKCKRMHIGKKQKCEDLHIDNWVIEKTEKEAIIQLNDVHRGKVPISTVSHQLYLGEVVSVDGTNKLNLDKRTSRGQGIHN